MSLLQCPNNCNVKEYVFSAAMNGTLIGGFSFSGQHLVMIGEVVVVVAASILWWGIIKELWDDWMPDSLLQPSGWLLIWLLLKRVVHHLL